MNKRYRISANYTVEAAFVVPIILGIIFSMIYMLFILHDKVILHENIRYNVICIDENGGNYIKKSNNKKSSNKKIMTKASVSKNLRIFKVTKLECNVGKIYIKTEVKAVSKLDIPVIGYFMRKTKKIHIKTKHLKVGPETMVRYRKNEE